MARRFKVHWPFRVFLGGARGVLIQAGEHEIDDRALADILANSPGATEMECEAAAPPPPPAAPPPAPAPEPEPEPEEDEEVSDDLHAMTKAELRAMLESWEIEAPTRATKDDLIALAEEQLGGPE